MYYGTRTPSLAPLAKRKTGITTVKSSWTGRIPPPGMPPSKPKVESINGALGKTNKPPELSAATYRHFAGVAADRGITRGATADYWDTRAKAAFENPLPKKGGTYGTDAYGNTRFDYGRGSTRKNATGKYNPGDKTRTGLVYR